MGPRTSRGREGFGGFSPIGLNGIFLTEMYLTHVWNIENISI